MPRVTPESLQCFPIFSALDHAALTELAGLTRSQVYARGALTGDTGGPASLALVARGSVRLYHVSPRGREMTLRTVDAGHLVPFCSRGEIEPPQRQAEALIDDTVLYRCPTEPFLRLVTAQPRAARALCAHYDRWLADAYDLIVDVALHSIGTRLAHALARLGRGSGAAVLLPQETLAAATGTTQEEVSRALSHLAAVQLIARLPNRRGIVILDQERLADL